MKSSTRLDSAIFQLTPTRTRYDLIITANGKTEKIASGLLNPFLAHLKTAQDQIAKGGYSILLQPEPGSGATWFTKGTVEMFVRFVSTPEILERVYTIESEILQIEEAISIQGNSQMGLSTVEDCQAKPVGSSEGSKPMTDGNEEQAIVLYKSDVHPPEANGSIAQEGNSKVQLLKVLETRKTVLQKEQGMAFAHAVAAVFATLVSFAECLGASRLMDACSWFIDLWKGKHETAEAMSNRSDFSAMNASGIMLSSMANKQNESHAASLDNRNKEVVVDVKQGSKKSDKDLKSKVAPDALDKKTVGPIRKGKTSKMSPWDDARARAEKVRAFKADLQKMKKKKEEEYRKRLEALKMEREKRIAAKTAQLASSQKTRKQLPTKLALSSVKGTKFSDSQPGSSCPPQRSKIRAASTGSSESHKASKSNKSSNGSHLPGNRLTRPVSSLPEPRKENSDVTPDPKVPMARIQRLSEPKTVSSPYVAPVKSRRAELGSLSLVNVIDLEPLPNMLQWKYALLRDLDKSLQDIQQQNEQHCEQEIEEIKRGIKSGNITPDASNIRFSDEVFDEQKHAIRIADEKVALAVQAYDLVDAHIQQLDQYLKKFDEELRRERESAATTGSAAQNLENNVKSTSGRGGRKKTRLAATTTASATANPTSMDLDLPVDPNEPTYCFCNQVSYGEMVACDNPDCKIEWFHFGCVGLKEQPKGKWYCSECVGMQKRRKGK